MKIQVKGMGHALPPNILSNQDLESMVDTTHQWIIERTGISERRIAGPETKNSDLSYEAAVMALQNSGIKPEELDLIIQCTVTPDMLLPSTACIIQERLQAWNAAAFDLGAGCTGFTYGLTVAEKFLLSPGCNNVLVIGAELLSRITDYTDRSTCIIFGDGAGAAVLGKGTGEYGIISNYIGADGRGKEHLYMPAGGSANPTTVEALENHLNYIKMNGKEVYKFASTIMEEIGDRLMTAAGLHYDDIDIFVPHQANIRIIKSAIKRMNIPAEKTLINIQNFGNMSAASIPVALSMAEQEGQLQAGDLVLMIAFGAGLTYGGTLLRWGRD